MKVQVSKSSHIPNIRVAEPLRNRQQNADLQARIKEVCVLNLNNCTTDKKRIKSIASIVYRSDLLQYYFGLLFLKSNSKISIEIIFFRVKTMCQRDKASTQFAFNTHSNILIEFIFSSDSFLRILSSLQFPTNRLRKCQTQSKQRMWTPPNKSKRKKFELKLFKKKIPMKYSAC